MEETTNTLSPPSLSISQCVTLKLSSTNYFSWKTQFESFLSSQSFLGYIDGSTPRPLPTVTTQTGELVTEAANPEFAKWMRRDQLVMSWLFGSLTKDALRALMAASRRSWSLSLMPPVILQKIFYKTPADALVRAKPTCKEWYALLTDETFINQHFNRSKEHFLRIFDTVQIMDPVTRTSSVSPVPNELLQHPFKIDTLVYTHMVHCDGLMLVESYMWKCRDDGSRFSNLALWNPVLRNLRWIEPSRSITSSDYHGIGYDKNNRSDGYKILRFASRPWEIERYEGDEPEVEIYECKTSSWRTLDVELDMDVNIMPLCVAVM